ncbi:MAG: histidine kinase [Cytophagales bacterium]|nr:histidine kinase [Cytophagales bacterium]
MKGIIQNKYFNRFVILFLLQLMIKGFDYTFGGFLDVTMRGTYFTLLFLSIWFPIWWISDLINKKVAALPELIQLCIHVIIGFAGGFLFNHLYRTGDLMFYNNQSSWEDVTFFNPELSVSLTIFHVLLQGIEKYLNSKIQIKEEQIHKEQIQKENILALYKSLKAQIEPHFLFNSLSVLSSIIKSDPDLASDFVVKLSKTLRYFIDKNEKSAVTLNEELQVVKDYFFLVKTRFGEAIEMKCNLNEAAIMNLFVLPASIQILLENAIKHNKMSVDHPLKVSIAHSDNFVVVENNLNKRSYEGESTSIGLKNLQSRYKLISNKSIIVSETEESFAVKIPLLTEDYNESFNN